MEASLRPREHSKANDIEASPSERHFVISSAWSDLHAIHEPQINAAILRRSMPPIEQSVREILARDYFPTFQLVFERGDDLDLIVAEIDHFLDLQAKDSFAFYEDLTFVAKNYLSITRAERIGLRLETIDTSSCQNFHVDRVHLRLVTTYHGRGTEWLQNDDVERNALGRWDASNVMRPGGSIQRLETAWLAIMKGEVYPDNKGNGFVHRSPPMDPTGSKRILLRIDVL